MPRGWCLVAHAEARGQSTAQHGERKRIANAWQTHGKRMASARKIFAWHTMTHGKRNAMANASWQTHHGKRIKFCMNT